MCTICAGFRPYQDECSYEGLAGDAAATDSATQTQAASVGTPEAMAEYLVSGYWEAQGWNAHSFDVSADNIITVNLTGLTAEGISLARDALAAWESVANLQFQETTGTADITFDDESAGAYASSTSSGTTTLSSSVNISTNWLSSYGTQIGTYSFQTYMHEIGHALGLGHQGGYNGSATYGSDETFANDSWQASVMSYFSQSDNTTIDASRAYLGSTMPVDVLAIQSIYGAASDSSLTAGDTVYGVGHTLGDSWMGRIFNAQQGLSESTVTNAQDLALTIWDQGGYDVLDFSNDTDAQNVDLTAGAASDIYGLTGNLQIAYGAEIEEYRAGSGNDVLSGNTADNRLDGGAGDDTISGGAGADTILGGAGADRMDGGAGNDTYYVDNAGDSVTETSGNGQDAVISSVSFVLRNHSQHIENLTLTGSSDLNGTGNGGGNTITGNAGDNVLNGAWGNDTLIGGAGDDRFVDDSGADRMEGGSGNDTYYVDHAGDRVIETSGNGQDAVISSVSFVLRNHSQHIENLTLTGSGDINGTGNGGGNTITGNAGDNVLNGAWGNDTLIGGAGDDRFVDDSGADRMEGGSGNDTYYVDHAGDRVIETSGNGQDAVISSVSFVLRNHSQHIETLTLTGNGNINGTGNGQANHITGNAGNNTLNGAWGNDVLNGGAGDDVLTGGVGADQFVFDAEAGTERVTDYTDGEDQIVLVGGQFSEVTIVDLGADTRIVWNQHEITLSGVDHSLLDASDFLFSV